jgi:hypothetical protein
MNPAPAAGMDAAGAVSADVNPAPKDGPTSVRLIPRK